MSDNNQDITIANQQKRPSEADLGWFAGIIDGEGSLTININSTRRSIYPRLWIAAISKEMIEKCIDTLEGLGVEYLVRWEVASKDGIRKSHHYVAITTCKRLEQILEVIKDYLVVKRKHADLVLEFCKIRLSLPYGHPYTQRELELFQEIKPLQIKKGKSTSSGILNDYMPSGRPRYKNNTPRNIRYRELKNIKPPEDIV